MHRGAPAPGIHDSKIDLQIILHAHGGFRAALCKDGFNKRHREKSLHCFFNVCRGRENIHVMNDFLHAAQTAGVSHSFGLGLEVLAKLRRDGNRAPEQVIPSSAAVNIDAFQDVIDGLLFEARNAEKLVCLAERFEFLDCLNAKRVIDLLGGLGADTRDLDNPGEPERNFQLQFLVELNFSGLDVLGDLVGKIFANAWNVSECTAESDRFDVVRKPLNIRRSPAIGADPKRICALNFEKVRNLIKDECDFEVSHSRGNFV